MGCWMECQGSISGRRKIVFSTPQRNDLLWTTPNLLSNGYLEVKRPGREADHLPPSSAEDKNTSQGVVRVKR
jgi:hypothetical protein